GGGERRPGAAGGVPQRRPRRGVRRGGGPGRGDRRRRRTDTLASMSYAPSARLPQHVGDTVTVAGWLTNLRSSGKIAFLQLRDGRGLGAGVVGKDAAAA